MYLMIKNLHMTLAMLSILGFIIRGPLAIRQHAIMQQKLLRILPHIVDTFLLLAAIYLAWTLSLHPFNSAGYWPRSSAWWFILVYAPW